MFTMGDRRGTAREVGSGERIGSHVVQPTEDSYLATFAVMQADMRPFFFQLSLRLPYLNCVNFFEHLRLQILPEMFRSWPFTVH